MATTVGQSSASGAGRPRVPAAKPRELEDWLNRRLFHPLSRRLAAVLSVTFVTPNMVSITGALMVVLAGALYSFGGPGWAVAAGFTLHMLWHVVDGADGDLARMTGRASPLGETIDGACDYLSHALIYLFLAIHLADWIGGWAYALGWAAGLSRVAQANHSESQRRIYQWRVYGVPWMQQAEASGDALFRETGGLGLLGRLARAYMWLAHKLTPMSRELDRAAQDPATRRRLSRLCRRAFRLPLVLQTLLGPNSRTLLLGASMALGSPLYYFLAEVTLYNLLLAGSVQLQKRRSKLVASRLRG